MWRQHKRFTSVLRCWLGMCLLFTSLPITQPALLPFEQATEQDYLLPFEQATNNELRFAQVTETGQISGFVTDTDHGPITSVWVQPYDDADGDGLWQEREQYGYTDDNGAYTICCLPPGQYRIGFSHHEYQSEYYDNADTLAEATMVSVTANTTTAGINADLADRGLIRGQVIDRRDDPLKDVSVTAFLDADGDGTWQHAAYASTDQAGEYVLDRLERGTYRVSVDAPSPYIVDEYYNNADTIEGATDIFVDTSAIVDGIDVQLAGAAGRIDGIVTDETGQPLANVNVSIENDLDHDGVWQTEHYEYTDGDGTYMVAGLPDGAYRVRFAHYVFQYKSCPYLGHAVQYFDRADTVEDATLVIVERERTQTNINAHLIAPSRIEGRVTDWENQPTYGVEIVALRIGQSGCFSTRPERDGTYQLGIDVGSYHIFFRTGFGPVPYVSHTSEYYDDVASEEAATPVTVGPRAVVSGIDAQLAPAGTIRGRVTDANGVGLSQIQVTAYEDENGDGVWHSASTAETDGAGWYAIPGVGAYSDVTWGVPYRVGFQDLRSPPRYHPLFYTYAGYPEQGEDIFVDDHMEVGIDTTVLPAHGTINFAPLAHPDTLLVCQAAIDEPWRSLGSILTNDADTENSPLHVQVVDAPRQGTLTLHVDGSFDYLPESDSWRTDLFTYSVDDGVQASETVTVTISPAICHQCWLPIVTR